LDCEKAMQMVQQAMTWLEQGKVHTVHIQAIGDVVLARKDIGTSYHIAVVVDDALQAVSHVIRGDDLSNNTAIHVLLQQLLGLPTPIYQHHALLCDVDGQRLAKSRQSICLRHLFEAGLSHQSLRDYLNHCDGIWEFSSHTSATDIVQQLGS